MRLRRSEAYGDAGGPLRTGVDEAKLSQNCHKKPSGLAPLNRSHRGAGVGALHAIYGGEEAQILIDTGAVLAGTLPRTAAKLVREWAELRRGELVEDWRRAQALEELLPVDGLQ